MYPRFGRARTLLTGSAPLELHRLCHGLLAMCAGNLARWVRVAQVDLDVVLRRFSQFLTCLFGEAHTKICMFTFFALLGWRLSTAKLAPYDQCCKVLGVHLDLTRSVNECFEVQNTEARKCELTAVSKQLCQRALYPRVREKDCEADCSLRPISFSAAGRRVRNCLWEATPM